MYLKKVNKKGTGQYFYNAKFKESSRQVLSRAWCMVEGCWPEQRPTCLSSGDVRSVRRRLQCPSGDGPGTNADMVYQLLIIRENNRNQSTTRRH